jgi:hypothetical protein
MPPAVRLLLVAFGVIAALVAYGLFLLYPAVPKSSLGWLALIVLGIPTILFLEWLGEYIASARVFVRLSRSGRVAVGVPVFIAVIVATTWLIGKVSGLINL